MKKNTFSELTNEELLKKITFVKSILAALVMLYFIIFSVLLFLYLNKDFGQITIALFVPVFIIPMTFLPLMINYRLLRTEKKSRNL